MMLAMAQPGGEGGANMFGALLPFLLMLAKCPYLHPANKI